MQGPLEKIHKENTFASGTPATDGVRVFVTFRVGDDIKEAASGQVLLRGFKHLFCIGQRTKT